MPCAAPCLAGLLGLAEALAKDHQELASEDKAGRSRWFKPWTW